MVGCGGANSASDPGGGGNGGAIPADLGARSGDLAQAPPDEAAPPYVPDEIHQIAGVTVATLAGSSQRGAADGTGASAQLNNPVGLALDGSGLLYVTEYDGDGVRTIDAAGVTHTIVIDAGTGAFACPFAVAVAGAGEIMVQTDCDATGDKNETSGTLWRITVATGAASPVVAGLGRPRGLAYVDAATLVVSDLTVETVSLLAPPATSMSPLAGGTGTAGYVDATGAAARFDGPYGLARLADGRILVADSENRRLRAVAMSGAVTTIAGGLEIGTVDGPRAASRFVWPTALAVDAAGEIFVSDRGSQRIRRIAADGTTETVAGDGSAGFVDGDGASAEFYGQEGIAVTPDGKTVYVADGNGGDGTAHHRVRVIRIP